MPGKAVHGEMSVWSLCYLLLGTLGVLQEPAAGKAILVAGVGPEEACLLQPSEQIGTRSKILSSAVSFQCLLLTKLNIVPAGKEMSILRTYIHFHRTGTW